MAFSTSQVNLANLDQQNFFETTLKQAVTDGTDTNIYLNSLPTPTEGFLTIEPTSTSGREIIHYNSKGADYVTVPSASTGRGIGGTTAQGHAASSVVRIADAAEYFRSLRDYKLTSSSRQDNSTNTIPSNQKIQSGWGFITASGTPAYITGTITFPTAFTARPIITVAGIGRKSGSDPSHIGDLTGGQDGGNIVIDSISTTGANITIWFLTAAGNGYRYGYSWTAIGA